MLHADCLLAYQQALDNRDLVEFSAPVGLDLPQFIREMARAPLCLSRARRFLERRV